MHGAAIGVGDAGAQHAGDGMAGIAGAVFGQACQYRRRCDQHRRVVDGRDRDAGAVAGAGVGRGRTMDRGIRFCSGTAAALIPGAVAEAGARGIRAVGHKTDQIGVAQSQRAAGGHAANSSPGAATIERIFPCAIARSQRMNDDAELRAGINVGHAAAEVGDGLTAVAGFIFGQAGENRARRYHDGRVIDGRHIQRYRAARNGRAVFAPIGNAHGYGDIDVIIRNRGEDDRCQRGIYVGYRIGDDPNAGSGRIGGAA